MYKIKRILVLGLLLIAILATSACAAPKEEVDVSAIQTEAVIEAMAQLTVNAALNPSATPVPPTMTPLPTATVSTVTPTKKVYYSSGGSGSSGSSGTAIPTYTPDVYICKVLSEDPLDGPLMTGSMIDKVWKVKNAGSVTWDKDEYYYEWIEDAPGAGLLGESADLSPKHQYKLPYDVEPGDTVDIIIDVEIPTQPVSKIQVAYWGIINDNGDIFCNLPFVVTYTFPAPTKTPTPKD